MISVRRLFTKMTVLLAFMIQIASTLDFRFSLHLNGKLFDPAENSYKDMPFIIKAPK